MAKWSRSTARAGRTSAILGRVVEIHLAAFDVLWIEGKDLRPLLLTRRKQLLARLIPATTTVLSQIFSVKARGRDMYAAAERLDLEGIVAKRMTDPYGPATVWYKIKSRTYT